MPSYSFKGQFVPFVEDGTKEHTVRGFRKNAAKPGSMLYLFSGLRTKYSKRLRTEICTQVDTIFFYTDDENVMPYGAFIIILKNKILTEIEAAPYLEDVKRLTDDYRGSNQLQALATKEALDRFAYADGFRHTGKRTSTGCFLQMLHFWKNTHQLPWAGHLIHWQALPF